MYHSITFGEKNTWDDWHLISKVRPSFEAPTPRTKYVEIPGASEKLDFSESLTGYPLYENRTGTFEFTVLNSLDEVYTPWQELYSEIMEYLNGKRMRAILEDDPNYFYEGRFAVEKYKAGSSQSEPRSTISIKYDVGPYKWTIQDSTDDDWLWDPFNFETGRILSKIFKNVTINTTQKKFDLNKDIVGIAPFCPTFQVETSVENGIYVRLVNHTLGTDVTKHVLDGESTFYDLIFYGDMELYYWTESGTGTYTINFKQGRL